MIRHLAVFAGFLALSIVATWPMARELGIALPGEKCLVTHLIYRTLVSRPIPTWFDPTLDQLNFPDGGSAVVTALPQFLVARVLMFAMGPMTAFNVSLLLHMALGGYAGWRLSRRVWGALPGGEWPHLAAGAVIGMSSFMVGVWANGQPENLGVGYIVLAAEAAWAIGTGAGVVSVIGLAAGIAAAFLSSPYLVMGFLFVAAPLLLARAARRRTVAVAIVAVAIVIGGLSAHFAAAMPGSGPRVLCPTMLATNPAADVRVAPGAGVLRPPPRSAETQVMDLAWVFRPPTLDTAKAHERLVGYLGVLAVALATAGIASIRPKRWILLAIAAPAILALGPNLTFNGWALTLGDHPIRLPLWWLLHIKGLSKVFHTINAPVRLVVGLLLPLSLAVAVGTSRLPRALGPVVVTLLVLDQLLIGPARPPQATFALKQYGVYTALAAQADRAGVLDTPPVGAEEGSPPVGFIRTLVQDAWRHRHPTPYAGCFPPLYNKRLEEARFPRLVADIGAGRASGAAMDAAVDELRRLGFGWWVIHTGTGIQSPEADTRILVAAQAELRQVASSPDGTYLFALSP